jgi:hypothetical protein
MAVALEKMPVIGGGTVDVSRPNDSGLHTLAQALDVGIRSAAEIGQVAQANELNHINSLMNDSQAGPDEIAEIAENAYFPLNKYAAKNRMGEAVIAQNRTSIEDRLATAHDPVAAREMLREEQQRYLKDVNDPAVAVGIREGIANLSPGALNEASRRRRETLNLQKRQAESVIFNDAIDASPEAFAAAVHNSTYDQTLADATKVHEVHDTAAQTLLNAMIEDPGSVTAAKDAAYAAINGVEMSANDRAKYTAVIHAAHTYERSQNQGLTATQQKASLFDNAARSVTASILSGQPVDPESLRILRENSTNPFTTEANIITLTDKMKDRTTGILGSTIASEARGRLKMAMEAELNDIGEKPNPKTVTQGMQDFDFIMESIPASLLNDDPYEARKQVRAAHDTVIEHSKHREERIKAFETKKTEAQNALEVIGTQADAAEKAGDFAGLKALESAALKLESFLKKDQYDMLASDLYEDAVKNGISLIDFRH